MKLRFISMRIGILLFLFTTGILVVSALVIPEYMFYRPSLSQNLYQAKKSPSLNIATPVEKDKSVGDIPIDIFRSTVTRLRVLSENGRFQDLIREGDTIHEKWGASGGERYGTLFLEFLRLLQSNRVADANSRALDLSQHYAVVALSRADSYDLETEWAMLRYLRYPVGVSTLEITQIEQRQTTVELWLHILHRLRSDKDEGFDPKNVGTINVEPPSGVNGFPGMSPEKIMDPTLRAEYEKAIDANAQKVKYYDYQLQLRKDEIAIVKDAVKYISKMYEQSLRNFDELNRLMSSYKISDDVKISIRKKIRLKE
jgi:hypothetical protein